MLTLLHIDSNTLSVIQSFLSFNQVRMRKSDKTGNLFKNKIFSFHPRQETRKTKTFSLE